MDQIVKKYRLVKSVTLIDAVLAVALFAIIFTFALTTLLLSQDNIINSGIRERASLVARETVSALENIRQDDFDSMADGSYGLSTSTGKYTLVSSTPDTLTGFTRQIDIVTLNYVGRSIVITISWLQGLSQWGSLRLIYDLYNWGLGKIDMDSKAEMDAGYRNSLKVSDDGTDAEVILARSADWSRNLLYRTYNMTGSVAGRDAAVYRYYLYVMQAANSGGPELTRFDINNLSVGELVVDKTWEVGRTLYSGYFNDSLTKAYFASDGSNEITILDLTTNSFSSINTAGTIVANDIWVNGSKIFMVKNNDTSNPELEIYNTSGTRIGTREIGANATKVIADSQYAYVTTGLDAGELFIIDHTSCSGTSPYTCTLSRQYDMSGTADATAMAHGTSTDWYFGRSNGEISQYTIASPASITSVYSTTTITTSINDIQWDSYEQLLTIASYRSSSQELTFLDWTNKRMYTRDLTGSATVYNVAKYGGFVYAPTSDTSNEIQTVRALGENWDDPVFVGYYNTASTTDANQTFVASTTAYTVTDKATGHPELFITDVTTPSAPTLLGTLEIGYDVNDIVVVGDYAYLATPIDNQEVIVVNIANSASPSIVGSVDLPTGSDGMALVGDMSRNYLFVGTANNTTGTGYEMYTIDLSGSKSSLTWNEGYNANGTIYDMDYDEGHQMVYISSGYSSQELQVIDTSVPEVSVKVDGYNTYSGTPYGVDFDPETQNSFLVLNNNSTNYDFYMFESSGAENIVPDWSKLASVSFNGDPYDDGQMVAVDNYGYAYLGTSYDYWDGDADAFYIFDITNVSNPTTVASYYTAGDVYDLKINGDYAYLATNNYNKEFQVINMVDRANPVESTYYNISGSRSLRGIDQIASTTYTGDSSGYFYVFDTSATNTVSLRGTLNTGMAIREMSAGPDYVTMATDSGNTGLFTVDVRNWSSMSVADTYSTNTNCSGIFYEKAKDRVFLGCSDSGSGADLFIIDATDPTNLYLLGSKDTGDDIRDIYVWGTNAYLATSNSSYSVRIYSVATSSNPTYTGYFDGIGSANAVTFDGSYVYMAGRDNSAEFQISSSGWKTQSFLSLYKALDLKSDNYDVVADDDYAFVATGVNAEGLTIVDVSTTIVPQQVASFAASSSYGVSLNDVGDVFLSSGNNNMEMQIFSPSPEVKGFVDVGWFTSAPYDAGVSAARWKYISWSKATTTGSIIFHIRTAPNNAGAPGTWSDWLGPSSAEDAYVDGTMPNQINALQRDRVNDQWFQYRAVLRASSTNESPQLLGITVYYD